jgi:exopolysaccharide production protein ExoQ
LGWWILVLIFMLATAPAYRLFLGGPIPWEHNPEVYSKLHRLNWFFMYFLMFLFMATDYWKLKQAIQKNALFLIFLFGFFLSSLWSPDVKESLIGISQLFYIVVFGLCIAERAAPWSLLKALYTAMMVLVLASLLVSILIPQYGVGIYVNAGAWRGIYVEKNHLAAVCAYGFASCFCLAMRTEFRNLKYLISLIIILFVSVMVKSSILTVSIFAVPAIFVIAYIYNNSKVLGGMFLLISILFLFSAILLMPIVLDLLGEDATFNGRTELWAIAYDAFAQRPFFGYGYRGFWPSMHSEIFSSISWNVRSSHNSWIEVALQAGVFGLLCLGGIWLTLLNRVVVAVHKEGFTGKFLIAVVGFVQLIWSFFENTQLVHMSFHVIIFAIVYGSLRSSANNGVVSAKKISGMPVRRARNHVYEI